MFNLRNDDIIQTDGWTPKDRSDNSYVQLTEQSALIRDVLSRTYGAPLIRLHESQCYQDNNYSQHANLLPASFIVESNHNFFIIHVGIFIICTL